MYELVILSGQAPSNQFMSRFAGPHRLATELRQHNIPTKVIIGLGYYPIEELISMVDGAVTDETLVLGISTTFFVEYSARFAMFPSRLYSGDKFKSNIIELLKYYKSKFPKIKVVVGGPSARIKITDSSLVDLFVEGYADTILIDYVNSIKGVRKNIFYDTYHQGVPFLSNPLGQDFNFKESMIHYHPDDAIMQGETLPLELSRGCIFKCKFCTFPLRGKSVKDDSFIKNSDNVYVELIKNYENFGTTNYTFVDDTFNDSMNKLSMLNEIFEKLPFKINFAAYIRADLLHSFPESIDILSNMGIKGAFFGIESLNDSARKAISKGFSTEKILKTLEIVNKKWNKVAITASFIYGLPGDTPATIAEWTDSTVFGSNIFKTYDLIFQPLYLLGKNATYASDFDKEMEKYNYRYVEGQKNWVNDVTNFAEMLEMTKDSNLRSAEIKRPFSSFHCLTLMGYGLTFEQVMNLDSHNPKDIKFVENMTIKKYKQYQKMITRLC